MASVNNESNGRKTIQFVGGGGKRKSIRPGKMTRKAAAAFKLRVEHLVSASITGHPLDEETSRWLAGLEDEMIDRLAAVGLARRRSSALLGDYPAKYITTRRDLKPASVRKLDQTKGKLLAYFDAETLLRSITTNNAADWRVWLTHQSIARATIKQHVGNAKTIFNEAVGRDLLQESPFRNLKGGSTASCNTRYVTPEEAEKVLDACPTVQWRALFALARYAGLRVPSETHLLTWADVDWERGRLTVRSPKTEHHAGHEHRMVPITPNLMRNLEDAFDAAKPGLEHIVTITASGQLRRRLVGIVKRAGVEPWPDVFQTLRRSCEKEWAAQFPQSAVSKWIGHSITVSGKHYANSVPDELFDKAAKSTAREAVQNPVQHPAASARNSSQTQKRDEAHDADNPAVCGALQQSATGCVSEEQWSRGESNPRAGTVSRPRLHV